MQDKKKRQEKKIVISLSYIKQRSEKIWNTLRFDHKQTYQQIRNVDLLFCKQECPYKKTLEDKTGKNWRSHKEFSHT